MLLSIERLYSCVGLAFGRSGGEGGKLFAGGLGQKEPVEADEVHAEVAGVEELRDEADVGESGAFAEAEWSLRWRYEFLAGVESIRDD